jgi:hypothetical protein
MEMNKSEFARLFVANVNRALQVWNVRSKPAREWTFEFHGPGPAGQLLALSDVVDRLYIDEDAFYRIIDIGVKRAASQDYSIFVRVSGHEPSKWLDTWNQPVGNGPFKVLGPIVS